MSAVTDPTNTTQRMAADDAPSLHEQRSACVVVIRGEGLGRRVDVGADAVVIGRSQDADLCLPHKSVSRRHCRLWRIGETYRIADLGATNTTRENDQKITEVVLKDGDHIALGEVILKFISHASVEAGYHEEVYQLATHDALTGLCNRRHFAELFDKELARAQRHQRPLALCMIDVDLFKRINDEHGHLAGDGVLKQLTDVLKRYVRQEDLVARIGGEEFAVVLPEADGPEAALFGERYRAAVEAEVFPINGVPHRLTISIGIACMSPERDDRSKLMRAADGVLYRAKETGRNRVELLAD